jgi:hypothetical protein
VLSGDAGCNILLAPLDRGRSHSRLARDCNCALDGLHCTANVFSGPVFLRCVNAPHSRSGCAKLRLGLFGRRGVAARRGRRRPRASPPDALACDGHHKMSDLSAAGELVHSGGEGSRVKVTSIDWSGEEHEHEGPT